MAYLVAVSLVWALSFGLIKSRLVGLDPTFVAWARMLVAVPLFLPWLRLRGLGPRLVGALLVTGAVQYGLMYMLYIAAYRHLAAHEVALFTVGTPIYVMLVDDALARRWSPRGLALAIAATLGAAILELRGGGSLAGGSLWAGFWLVQAANLCFALGQVVYRRIRRGRAELEDHRVYALLYVGALVVTSLGVTIAGAWPEAARLTGAQVMTLLYLGAVASGLCFFAWNKGALAVSIGTLAVFNNLKVPLAIIASLTVFGEASTLRELDQLGPLLLGGGVMLVAGALAIRARAGRDE